MQTPYEIASKSVIPAIRGMISRGLLERDLTQAQIAKALGVTQPAVSKYLWEKRGRAIDFDERNDVKEMTSVIADGIANHRLNNVQVTNMIKEICDYVMRQGYMCDLHYEVDPQVKNSNCKICMEPQDIANS
ncbi:MAG TPA: helix-turn-helix domain-containing protein [Nitrososphaerales archaeon]|nr:helix-turn-helix domain-containing protein [Nitrososphaerales archaeon]